MTNHDPQRDLHIAAAEVIRALDEPGANPEHHAKQRAHLHLNWPVLDQRLRDLRVAATFSAADTIEYGVECVGGNLRESTVRAIEYGCEWHRNVEIAKNDLRWFQKENPNANIRLIAHRVSPTWEVDNADI